jgi:hypothetical protein
MADRPPLSTEYIIAQLKQLRDLLPAPTGEGLTDTDGPDGGRRAVAGPRDK